jgi:thiopeptide-type bacteriocin biosynthesis protein
VIVWAQRNVALARPDGNPLPAARSLLGIVAALVEAKRASGEVDLFFFQRKAPDVRLRFGTTLDDGAAAPRATAALDDALRGVDVALDRLVAVGTLVRWFPGPYEPEVRKFGGPGAADACHRNFDAETRLWIAAQRFSSDEGPVTEPSPIDVATTSADDLFVRVLRDRDEVWDTWANLVDIAGDPDPVAPPPVRLVVGDDASGPLADELRSLASAHDAFAAAIAHELEEGTLRVGPRAILPFVAQLDLQRWGLGGPQQAAAATAMMTAWDPTQELRGR